MTDTQPAAQVEMAARRVRSDLRQGYRQNGANLAIVLDALEAAQREIAELRAELHGDATDPRWYPRVRQSDFDRHTRVVNTLEPLPGMKAAFAQGSDVTEDSEGRLHLADDQR